MDKTGRTHLLARVAVSVEDAVRVRVRLALTTGFEPRDKRLVPHLPPECFLVKKTPRARASVNRRENAPLGGPDTGKRQVIFNNR